MDKTLEGGGKLTIGGGDHSGRQTKRGGHKVGVKNKNSWKGKSPSSERPRKGGIKIIKKKIQIGEKEVRRGKGRQRLEMGKRNLIEVPSII